MALIDFLSENIKFLRTEIGLTQVNLSISLSLCKSTVGHWERGFVRPGTKELKSLSDLFEVSIDWMIRYDLSKKMVTDVYENYLNIKKALRE